LLPAIKEVLDYYDKTYKHGILRHSGQLITRVEAEGLDAAKWAEHLCNIQRSLSNNNNILANNVLNITNNTVNNTNIALDISELTNNSTCFSGNDRHERLLINM